MLFWNLIKRLLMVLVVLIVVDLFQPRLSVPIFPLLLIISAFVLFIGYLDGALGGKNNRGRTFTGNVVTVGVASILAIFIYNKWPETQAKGWIKVVVESVKQRAKSGDKSSDYMVSAVKDPNYKAGEIKVSVLKEVQSNYKVVENTAKPETSANPNTPVKDKTPESTSTNQEESGKATANMLFGPTITAESSAESIKVADTTSSVKQSSQTEEKAKDNTEIAKAAPTTQENKVDQSAAKTDTKETEDDKIPPHITVTNEDAKLASLETNSNTRDKKKSIDEAVASGDVERINELLKASGEGDERSDDMNKRLISAVSKGDVEKVNELLKAGANPNHVGKNKKPAYLLFRAANTSNAGKIIDALIKAGAKVDLQTENGLTALFLNTKMNRYDAVRVLLEAKANPNIRSGDGTTAVYAAVKENRTAILELLLSHGAKATIAHNDGTTPLMIAVIKSNQRAVEVLLQSGADIDARDKKGLNAKDYARAWSNDHINMMLSGKYSFNNEPVW